jgi:NTE family protein
VKSIKLSLALQGGGSFGAFTWGVLDRLLEDERIGFDGVSGTSAGALNAVALAAGLAEAGRPKAKEILARLWRRMSEEAPSLAPFKTAMLSPLLGPLRPAFADAALDLTTRMASPYDLNPLDFDPLRRALEDVIDFERLRQASPVRLFVAATHINTAQARIFRTPEITAEVVLASACLPMLQKAVEIDGEAYWDGGYSANPALAPLVEECRATDILLVQLVPTEPGRLPRTAPEIGKRIKHIAFSTPLVHELERLAVLKESGRAVLRHRLGRLRLHRIAADSFVDGLGEKSALNTSRRFLSQLHAAGREAAAAWISDLESGLGDRDAKGWWRRMGKDAASKPVDGRVGR